MRRFILTGTPGSGKTTILRELERRGIAVIEEAATDVIAEENKRGNLEHWRDPVFIENIAALQEERMLLPASPPSNLQFHDRSLICTYALCRHLGYRIPPSLNEAIRKMLDQRLFDPRVFFVENLGFVTPTEARKITYEDSLAFERTHRETYRSFGLDCISIGRGPILERTDAILKIAGKPSGS